MSDKVVLVLAAVVGIVVIAALVVFLYRGRGRLKQIDVKVPGARLKASMGSEGSPSGGGIVQRGVKAGGKVTALVETGQDILQENVEAGDSVEAAAKPSVGGGAAPKKNRARRLM